MSSTDTAKNKIENEDEENVDNATNENTGKNEENENYEIETITTRNIDTNMDEEDEEDIDEDIEEENEEENENEEEEEEIEEPPQPQKNRGGKKQPNKKEKDQMEQSDEEEDGYTDSVEEEEEEEEANQREQNLQTTTRRRGRPSNQSKMKQLMGSNNNQSSESPLAYSPEGTNNRGGRRQSNAGSQISKNKRQRSDDEEKDSESSEEIESDEDESMDVQQMGSINKSETSDKPQRGRPKSVNNTGSRSEERKRIQLQQYIQAKGSGLLQTSDIQVVYEDFDDEEYDEDDDSKKKSKNKSKNKSQASQLDIRPCWFVGCVKADRSLKILRPCLIPTCKTHAIKSEIRISDALKRGDFVADESTGAKDKVCGICGDKKELQHCTNNNCSFGFCNECVGIAAMKHNNQVTGNKWGKEKERTRWVKEQFNPGLPSIGRKYRRALEEVQSNGVITPEKRQQQQQGYDPSISPNQQPNKRLRKKINNDITFDVSKKYKKKNQQEDDSAPPSPTTGKVVHEQGFPVGSHNPPSPNTLMGQQLQQLQQTHQQARLLKSNPQPESVLSPARQQETPVDNFIDQAFSAVKYFASLSPNAPDGIKEKVESFVENVMRVKTIRWSSNYDLVWRMIDDLATLVKKNLGSSQSIMEMYKEIRSLEEGELENMTNNSQNIPLDRAITMVFDNHETAGLIGKECCSARNSLIYSIEMALRSVADYQRDLELTIVEETVRSNKVTSEIEQIDEQIKTNLGEIHKFKFQEVELLDSLSKVRGAIAAHEAIRDTLQKKSNDLKVDMLLIKNNISNKEKETKSQQATLENEVYALKLIINMVESIYWIHDYFYETKVSECEKLINNKLQMLQNRLDLQIPRVQSLLYDREGNPIMDQPAQGIPKIEKFKTLAIYHKLCMKHKVPNFHLEKPDRIQVTVGCINEYADNPLVDILDNPPEVDMRYVMAVHDANYIKKLETSLPPENSEFETHLESDKSGAMVTVASHKDFEGDDDNIYDTFVSHLSMKAALRASGSVCAAVDAVSRAGYTRSFCAIRPPGHHAGRYGRTSDAPSQGYCLINNVAIGAKYASLTAGYSRIAVVDFDVHHGNGTQEILSGDDNFLFISIHVCDEKRYFYPGTGQDVGAEPDEVSGKYEGNILNIGLKRNTGSVTFLNHWVNKIIPRLEAYKPQLIFLSAGFDGHKDDPTNGLKLNEEDYFVITKMIKTVAFKYCKGRIVSVLEGGYGIEKNNSLQRCVNAHLKALIEDTEEEIHLANISYGHFNGEVSNSSIPKFNISNFISNPNKRGKKNNLNTINFINNNMNNINNTISSSINRQHNNNGNSQEPINNQTTTTTTTSSNPQISNDGENQNNSSSSSSPILISNNNTSTNNSNNTNNTQMPEEIIIQDDIVEIKNPKNNNNNNINNAQPSSPIGGVNRNLGNINMSGAQRGINNNINNINNNNNNNNTNNNNNVHG
ncbi:hypothetical protein DICPUDRAFT_149504 [Dictyostelium purpureum]|uniref:Histone deacetylase domain-containing protein n=1 Tax=Dictyostelium purpureum TaxID=5786 RepID=F0ZDX0_DICPU|nr:uncharacterized protein DICPUDRAFT_149504 [Dictyostelium purpureum]EGC37874.1 hypothetical protein DICPUDRAFT_149504 [Dictyostelium purpureum]|eukprot:XP_003285624.1 hypothetical protein DICPUDRAFT_149504 [Dictyostelium purpureum]